MSDKSGDEEETPRLDLEYESSGQSSSSSEESDDSEPAAVVFRGENEDDEDEGAIAIPDYAVEFGLYEPIAEAENVENDGDDGMEVDENRLLDTSW